MGLVCAMDKPGRQDRLRGMACPDLWVLVKSLCVQRYGLKCGQLPVLQGGALQRLPACQAIFSCNRYPLSHPLSVYQEKAQEASPFWLLNLGFLACGFQLAFIAAHLPTYLLVNR